jgi:hypothetical protein
MGRYSLLLSIVVSPVVKGVEYYKNLQLSDEEISPLVSFELIDNFASLQQFPSLVPNLSLLDLFFEIRASWVRA